MIPFAFPQVRIFHSCQRGSLSIFINHFYPAREGSLVGGGARGDQDGESGECSSGHALPVQLVMEQIPSSYAISVFSTRA